MAGQFSNFGQEQILSWLTGGGPTPPAGFFVALFTTAPGASAPGTEVVGNGYARVEAPLAVTPGSNPVNMANPSAIVFAAATANWGTITHIGLFDAATGGNFWGFATVNAPGTQTPTPVAVNTGQGFQINPGQLVVSLT